MGEMFQTICQYYHCYPIEVLIKQPVDIIGWLYETSLYYQTYDRVWGIMTSGPKL